MIGVSIVRVKKSNGSLNFRVRNFLVFENSLFIHGSLKSHFSLLNVKTISKMVINRKKLTAECRLEICTIFMKFSKTFDHTLIPYL